MTGDQDLLVLGRFESVEIVIPTNFLGATCIKKDYFRHCDLDLDSDRYCR